MLNNKLTTFLISLMVTIGIVSFTLAAPPKPSGNVTRTLTPETDSTYNIGQENLKYLYGWFDFMRIGSASTTGDLYVGGNATTTKSMDALEFCIDGQDCIDSWSSITGTTNWEVNASGELTPTTTIDVYVDGDIDISAGNAYQYNGIDLAFASTTKFSYFFANSGNSTMTGNYNYGLGVLALSSLTTGIQNSAFGYKSLQFNTEGRRNTAYGFSSMRDNIDGEDNTGVGDSALVNLLSGDYNTGVGRSSLYFNEAGSYNTCVGARCLRDNLGDSNVSLGYFAGAYETGSNSFYVNNVDRVNTAGDKALSLMYGTFGATAADQQLTINGDLTVNGNATTTGSLNAGDISSNNNVSAANSLIGSYLTSRFIGSIDMRGDPWYLSGTDLEIAQDLDVDSNLNVDGNSTTTGSTYASSGTFDDLFLGNATSTGSVYVGGDLAVGGNFPMNQVDGKIIGSPTLTNLEDYYNLQSAGFVTINGIDDDGDGTITVKAGYGIIKTEDSDSGENRFFDWATSTTVSLTDEATNWIYIDYNGGSPIPNATTDITSLDLHTEIVVGRVWKDGTTIQVLSGLGQDVDDYMTEACYKDFEVYGFQAVPGTYVLTEDGTRYLDITEGIGYCAHNRYTCSAKNTNTGGDTFTYVYRDGGTGFTFDDNGGAGYTQVSNILYDDGDGTPGNVNNNRYATYYVYETFADEFGTCQLYVQMGQNRTNNLSQAQMESVPTPPGLLRDFSNLVARIIIEKGDTNFTEIELNTPTTNFQASVVGNHNDLGNLPWGLSGHTGTVNTFAGFDGTGAATYYTEASYGQLAQAETITGTWTFNWLSATSSFQYWWNNTTTWAGFQNEFNKYYNASTTLVTSDYVWDFSDNTNATAGSNIQFNNDEIAVVDSPEFVNASTTGSLYVGGDLTVAGDTSVVNVTVVNTTSTGSIYVTNDLGLNSVYINSWSDINDAYGWSTSSEQYFWNNTSTWTAYDTNWNRNWYATSTFPQNLTADGNIFADSVRGGNTRINGDGIDFAVGAGKVMRFQNYALDYGFEFWGNDGLIEHKILGLDHIDGVDIYHDTHLNSQDIDEVGTLTASIATTTNGLYTQGNAHIGGNLTIDGTANLAETRAGNLHATTTDFDALQVNGNAQVTGFLNVTGNIITDSNLFADDIYVGPGYSYKYGTVPSNVTIAFADIALDNFFFASAGNRTMTGNYNNGLGRFALKENTTGIQNVAIGRTALEENTTGSDNTAIGTGSLNDNTEGYFNSAIGSGSLSANTTGHDNFALGYSSLFNNQTGNYNVAIGNYSLTSNVLGDNNIAIGYLAGQNALGSDNIFIGSYAGSNEVGTSTFYLGNKEQSNIVDDRTKSMMFGILDDDPLNQQLTFNTHFEVNGTTTLATTTFSFDDGNNIGSVSQVIFPSGGVPDIALGGKGIYMDVFGLKDYGYIYNTTETDSPLLGFGSFDTDNAAVINYSTTSDSLFFTLATPNEAGDEVETKPFTGFTVFSENVDFSASSSNLIINYSVVGNNEVEASLTFSSTTDQLSWTGASGYNFDNDIYTDGELEVVGDSTLSNLTVGGSATTTGQFNIGNNTNYLRSYLIPGVNIPVLDGYSDTIGGVTLAAIYSTGAIIEKQSLNTNPSITFKNYDFSDEVNITYGTTTDILGFTDADYAFVGDTTLYGNVTTSGNLSVGEDTYSDFNYGDGDLNVSGSIRHSTSTYSFFGGNVEGKILGYSMPVNSVPYANGFEEVILADNMLGQKDKLYVWNTQPDESAIFAMGSYDSEKVITMSYTSTTEGLIITGVDNSLDIIDLGGFLITSPTNIFQSLASDSQITLQTESGGATMKYTSTTNILSFSDAIGYSFDNNVSMASDLEVIGDSTLNNLYASGNSTTTGHMSVGVDDNNFSFGTADMNVGDNLYVGLDLLVNQNVTTTGSLWVSDISTLATTTMSIGSKIKDTDASYYFSVEGYDLNDPGDLGASITNIPTIVFHNSSELLGNNAGIMNGELIIIEDIYSAGNEEDDMPKLTFASNDISNILNGSASSIEYNTTTDVLNFTDAVNYTFDTIVGIATSTPWAGYEFAVDGDTVIKGELLIANSNEDYKILAGNVDNLFFQSITSGTAPDYVFSAADGDGTDGVNVLVCGVGNSLGITNSECMTYGYTPAGTSFFITTAAAGTGTVRDLVIGSGADSNALTFDATTGKLTVDNDLTINDNATTTGSHWIDGDLFSSAQTTLASTTLAYDYSGDVGYMTIQDTYISSGALAGTIGAEITNYVDLVIGGFPVGQQEIGAVFSRQATIRESLDSSGALGPTNPNLSFNTNDLSSDSAVIEYATTTDVLLFTNASGGYSFDTDIIVGSGSSYTNYAVCYLSTGQLGHCTDAVDASGQCTCASN